jgi:hypothetical protein
MFLTCLVRCQILCQLQLEKKLYHGLFQIAETNTAMDNLHVAHSCNQHVEKKYGTTVYGFESNMNIQPAILVNCVYTFHITSVL